MNRTSFPCRSQAGFSLTEVMVAVTLGLILLGGVIQVFAASKQSFNIQQGVSRAQEGGRFGLYTISRVARQAGYYRDPTVGRDRLTNAISSPFPPAAPAVFGVENGNFDSLFVRFQSNADNSLVDCLGVPVNCGTPAFAACAADPVNNPVTATNMFDISPIDAADPTGPRSLRCTRSLQHRSITGVVTNIIAGAPAENLIEGVTSFQVQYGLNTDADPRGIADRYVNANAVTQWSRVSSIRITLVTNSVERVGAGTTAEGSDGNQRLIQTYTQTIDLRNI